MSTRLSPPGGGGPAHPERNRWDPGWGTHVIDGWKRWAGSAGSCSTRRASSRSQWAGSQTGPASVRQRFKGELGELGGGGQGVFFFFDVGRVACGATASAEACRKGHANAVSVTASSFPPFRFRDMQIFSWWARIMRSQTL
jgi:hypothetical protein